MRSTILKSICLICAVAAAAPAPAWADFIYFKDDNPTKISVSANGFAGAPLTLDGRFVFNKQVDHNEFKSMPKGKRITFTGTDSDFYTPYNFTSDYIFVSKGDVHVPVAELLISGVATGSRSEAFTGTFRGFGDPTLPGKIPKGAIVETTGRRRREYGDTIHISRAHRS